MSLSTSMTLIPPGPVNPAVLALDQQVLQTLTPELGGTQAPTPQPLTPAQPTGTVEPTTPSIPVENTITVSSLITGLTDYTSTATAPIFIDGTSDPLSVIATGQNAAITTGTGNDRITVTSGENSLDGGAGSNLLIGGSGTDAFSTILDSANAWTTIDHFHPGDTAVIWGFIPGVSIGGWAGEEGRDGLQGETLSIASGLGNQENITFSGLDATAAASLQMAEGTTANGIPYLFIADPG
jgi:Ca2+-binding RTX toxin-like protein